DGDTPGLVAQNLDLPQWMHRYPTVLRIHHDGSDLESFVVTLPGLVGANGLNNHRVAVGVNTVLQIRPCPDGLPVAFVVRGLLAQRSHEAALQFLRSVKHASGQAYTVGGPEHSPCFEASAGGVVQWQPEGRDGWTWHTNHPLVSTDWSPKHLAAAKARGQAPEQRLQCARFDALDRALPAGKRPTFDDVVAALRTSGARTPVCNAGTYVCTVMVLGERPELHVSPGPPTRVPFQVLRFD
ncbi:MAG TPA: carcinine hydrolase/isopenicillin-N N-acyltransferase family protein, partial [Planctomycetota bacterium]|nr:carcinine hydrolase/isopenicillin-N N-acyltransferase family protein [Planctomycetota bacterium]